MSETAEIPEGLWLEASDAMGFWRSEGWVDIWAGLAISKPVAGSGADLVRSALLPGTHVNFPQITAICERTAANPAELQDTVQSLAASLRDRYADSKKTLKALTIVNEMMYDEHAVAIFRCQANLQDALTNLRATKDTGLGSAVHDNIRMLATEIERTCFSEGGPSRPRQPGQLSKLGSALKLGVGAAAGTARRIGGVGGSPGTSPAPKQVTWNEPNVHRSSANRHPPFGSAEPLVSVPSCGPQLPPGDGSAAPVVQISSAGTPNPWAPVQSATHSIPPPWAPVTNTTTSFSHPCGMVRESEEPPPAAASAFVGSGGQAFHGVQNITARPHFPTNHPPQVCNPGAATVPPPSQHQSSSLLDAPLMGAAKGASTLEPPSPAWTGAIAASFGPQSASEGQTGRKSGVASLF